MTPLKTLANPLEEMLQNMLVSVFSFVVILALIFSNFYSPNVAFVFVHQ